MYLTLLILSHEQLSLHESRIESCSFCIDLGIISWMFRPIRAYLWCPKIYLTFFEAFTITPMFYFSTLDSNTELSFSKIKFSSLKCCFLRILSFSLSTTELFFMHWIIYGDTLDFIFIQSSYRFSNSIIVLLLSNFSSK